MKGESIRRKWRRGRKKPNGARRKEAEKSLKTDFPPSFLFFLKKKIEQDEKEEAEVSRSGKKGQSAGNIFGQRQQKKNFVFASGRKKLFYFVPICLSPKYL